MEDKIIYTNLTIEELVEKRFDHLLKHCQYKGEDLNEEEKTFVHEIIKKDLGMYCITVEDIVSEKKISRERLISLLNSFYYVNDDLEFKLFQITPAGKVTPKVTPIYLNSRFGDVLRKIEVVPKEVSEKQV